MDDKGYFYYYDSEEKYYIGKKSIADNANYDLNGRLLMPGHATIIKPPINIEEGYVPVFNEYSQKWEVKKDDFWHCTVNVYPHHFGEFPVEWLPQLYAFNTLGVMNIDNSIRLNNLFTQTSQL